MRGHLLIRLSHFSFRFVIRQGIAEWNAHPNCGVSHTRLHFVQIVGNGGGPENQCGAMIFSFLAQFYGIVLGGITPKVGMVLCDSAGCIPPSIQTFRVFCLATLCLGEIDV